mgnify:CR=1 FL=1
MANTNYDGRHLTTTPRIKIEKGLLAGESLASIARKITKHSSTVAKGNQEIPLFSRARSPSKKLPCLRKKNCQIRFLCDKKDCVKLGKTYYDPSREADCREICPDYAATVCSKIQKALMSAMGALSLNAVRFSMPSIPLSGRMRQPMIFWFPAATELTSLRPTSPCSMTSFPLY